MTPPLPVPEPLRPSSGSIDDIVANEPVPASPIPAVPATASDLLPLEDYVRMFTDRYRTEQRFRTVVHQYLKISRTQRALLSAGKSLRPGWYRKRTDTMVRNYATRIREGLATVRELRQELGELQGVHQHVAGVQTELERAQAREREAREQLERERLQREQEIARLNMEYARKRDETAQEIARREAAVRSVRAEDIVAEKVQEFLRGSELLRVEDGALKFDELVLSKRLEDLFLDEILQGIEREDGNGFMTRVKNAYDGLIDYWDRIESVSDLPRVDWVRSAILSRQHGYQHPTYPYLVVGVNEEGGMGRASVNSAVALDTSGSMERNQRLQIATKSTLALAALMRRLNPERNTALARFSDDIEGVTSLQLLRNVRPDGSTRTDFAIDWLREQLEGKGPGVAYLITDGKPESNDGDVMKSTLAAARRFGATDNIMLRIFLIDGQEDTRNIVRQIGAAAGRCAKFVPVDNYRLPNGMIRDVSEVITGMYDFVSP